MMVPAFSDNLLSNDTDGLKLGIFSVNFANAHKEFEHSCEFKVSMMVSALSDNRRINNNNTNLIRSKEDSVATPKENNFANGKKDSEQYRAIKFLNIQGLLTTCSANRMKKKFVILGSRNYCPLLSFSFAKDQNELEQF